mmetsp:Transcript_17085/g.19580  ORF Transcript_17085/g.19580 Transcript_17085/m.19580 type:complete len:80 (+) Transcript_17085:202-441(+)
MLYSDDAQWWSVESSRVESSRVVPSRGGRVVVALPSSSSILFPVDSPSLILSSPCLSWEEGERKKRREREREKPRCITM